MGAFADKDVGPQAGNGWGLALVIALSLFLSPSALAAPGDILVVDKSAFVDDEGGIFRVDPATGARTSVSNNDAPFPSPLFKDPAGIALEADGDILVTDLFGPTASEEGAVLRVDPVTGLRSTVSHNTTPTGNPEFVDPQGIAVDSNGDILVADYGAFGGSGGVIRVDPVTGVRSVDSSNTSPPGGPSFVDPIGLALEPDGDILVADVAGGAGGQVIAVDNPGGGNRSLVSSNTQPSGAPNFADPNGIVAVTNNNSFVADFTAFGGSGGVIGVQVPAAPPFVGARITVSENTDPPGAPTFIDPVGIAISPDGNLLVADSSAFSGPGGIIGVVPSTGARSTVSAAAIAPGPFFKDPMDLVVEPAAGGGNPGDGGSGSGGGSGDGGSGDGGSGDGGSGDGGDDGGGDPTGDGAPGVASIVNASARLKGRKLPIEIACEAGGSDCDGTLVLRTAKRGRVTSSAARRRVTLARLSFAIAAGASEKAKAKLTRPGTRLFRKRRRANADATITTTGAAGERSAADTLRVKRKRKR